MTDREAVGAITSGGVWTPDSAPRSQQVRANCGCLVRNARSSRASDTRKPRVLQKCDFPTDPP